ncbi:MAG: hypothetical protein AB7N76_18200 [Planctomycetota bacterium]
MLRPALASLALLLLCAPAGAQVKDGDYRVDGKLWPSRQGYTAVLHLERTKGDGWRLERTARRVDEDGRLEELTWAATEAKLSGDELRVRFRPGQLGAVGALEAIVAAKGRELEASYRFEGDGLSERIVVSDPPKDHWRLATGKGDLEAATLKLVREARFADLLGDRLDRYEASGVVLAGSALRVVFDNSGHVAEVPLSLAKAELYKTGGGGGKSDLEGLSHDPETGHSFAVVEMEKRHGEWMGRVWELDQDLRRVGRSWLKVELPKGNKGFEGLAHVRRGGEEYLLGLLEGNGGEAGEEALVRGEGRIEVFKRDEDGDGWSHLTTLKVPKAAYFYDYSGIDVRDGQVAIVSQTSSALWVGKLSPTAWRFDDEGQVYRFPRAASRVVYGEVEGVTWIGEQRLAFVSDAGSSGKAESIHIFDLP